jgi:hypothetical protein
MTSKLAFQLFKEFSLDIVIMLVNHIYGLLPVLLHNRSVLLGTCFRCVFPCLFFMKYFYLYSIEIVLYRLDRRFELFSYHLPCLTQGLNVMFLIGLI